MNDMSKVIVPDSTQINADDLLTGPMTIKITDVKIKGGKEQPVSIFFEGSDKAYRCCKSMARCLVNAWGADASKYIGRSLTLYCDPKVTWAGLAVGGIRISHMSDIEAPITMALTATRGNKKPFTVKPLDAAGKKTAAPSGDDIVNSVNPSLANSHSDAAATITPDEAIALEARCTDNNIKTATVKKFFAVEQFSQLTPAQLIVAHENITVTLAKRMEQAT